MPLSHKSACTGLVSVLIDKKGKCRYHCIQYHFFFSGGHEEGASVLCTGNGCQDCPGTIYMFFARSSSALAILTCYSPVNGLPMPNTCMQQPQANITADLFKQWLCGKVNETRTTARINSEKLLLQRSVSAHATHNAGVVVDGCRGT